MTAVTRRGNLAAALREVALIIAVGLALYSLAPIDRPWGWVSVGASLTALGLLAPFTVRRVRRVLASERPVADGVVAITGIFTALILGFSLIYLVLAQHPDQMVGLETRIDSVYFTVTTLATVGPGDIHAQGQAARVLVSLQVLVNVLVLAVAVRLLTRVTVERRRGERGRSTAPDA